MLGIFDSGVGGLTIWQEIKKRSPSEGILYFSDTAHMPYGEKSPGEILSLTAYGIQVLLDHGATHIVIGCNTVGSHLPPGFLESFSCPFSNIVDSALSMASSYDKIAVIATNATIASGYYQKHLRNRLIAAFSCPDLAPMIEKGVIELSVIQRSLLPLPPETKTLLYACSHFPLIDSYIALVSDVATRLDPATHLAKNLPLLGEGGKDIFLTSGNPQTFYNVASSLSHAKLSFPFSVKSLYF